MHRLGAGLVCWGKQTKKELNLPWGSVSKSCLRARSSTAQVVNGPANRLVHADSPKQPDFIPVLFLLLSVLYCLPLYLAHHTSRAAPSPRGNRPGAHHCPPRAILTDTFLAKRVKSFAVCAKLISSVALLLVLAVCVACWQQLRSQTWLPLFLLIITVFVTEYDAISKRRWNDEQKNKTQNKKVLHDCGDPSLIMLYNLLTLCSCAISFQKSIVLALKMAVWCWTTALSIAGHFWLFVVGTKAWSLFTRCFVFRWWLR